MQARLFFVASLYEAFELQLACEAEAIQLQQALSSGAGDGESSPSLEIEVATAASLIDQALGQCVRAMEEVSPGSDLHVILAAQHMHHALELHGSNSARSIAAAEAATQANLFRYGPTSTGLASKMIELNRTLYE